MLIGNPHPDITLTLASGQTVTGYQVVVLDNANNLACKLPTGNAYPIGVAQWDDGVTITGPKPITVRTGGVSRAIAAKAFSIGAHLTPTAEGSVTDTAPSVGGWFVGVALTPATQLGDEVLILVKPERNEA